MMQYLYTALKVGIDILLQGGVLTSLAFPDLLIPNQDRKQDRSTSFPAGPAQDSRDNKTNSRSGCCRQKRFLDMDGIFI
jgi:hypothetical protein